MYSSLLIIVYIDISPVSQFVAFPVTLYQI